MFQLNSYLVQVELGARAAQAFQPKDSRGIFGLLTGEKAPGWADLLIQKVDVLRENLKKQGLILPVVQFIYAQELPPEEFRITLGVDYSAGDIRRDNLFHMLEKRIKNYQIEDQSKEGIKKLLNECVLLVLNKDFQSAMEMLGRLYYWSTLIEGNETVRVISLLNMAGILMLNNNVNSAATVALQARYIAEKEDFYDPYLKFYTHKCMGNIFALQNDISSSIQSFNTAFSDIRKTGEHRYIVDALYSLATMLIKNASYEKSAGILDTLVAYIKNKEDYDKNVLLELYEMRALVGDANAAVLMQKNRDLQKKYDVLSESFLLKAGNAVLTIVSSCGPYVLTTFAGALVSGQKNIYNISQNSVNGNSILYAN